jgi:hypothetical protein
MPFFHSLVKLLSPRRPASRLEAEARIALAYQRVFTGAPSADDQGIVLVDFANFTGFYRVTPPEGGDRDTIVFNEGMRTAYGRIFQYLRMSDVEILSLEVAARQTAAQVSGLAPDQSEE